MAQQCRHNAGHAVDGSLDVVNALRVSSDDFFYNLGARTNADPGAHPNGGPLEPGRPVRDRAPHRVDLPGETTERCRPQPGAPAATSSRASATRHRTVRVHQRPRGQSARPSGLAPQPQARARRMRDRRRDRPPWSIGDNESLAVGQGDLQATPLQVAVAYAALANGGTIVRPHSAGEINSPGTAPHPAITPRRRATSASPRPT